MPDIVILGRSGLLDFFEIRTSLELHFLLRVRDISRRLKQVTRPIERVMIETRISRCKQFLHVTVVNRPTHQLIQWSVHMQAQQKGMPVQTPTPIASRRSESA